MVFRTAITGSFLFISLEKEKKKGGVQARENTKILITDSA